MPIEAEYSLDKGWVKREKGDRREDCYPKCGPCLTPYDKGMLTEREQEALKKSGELAGLISKIIRQTDPHVDNYQTWEESVARDDWREAADSIHKVQQLISAQSAAREHPELVRLLGHRFKTAQH